MPRAITSALTSAQAVPCACARAGCLAALCPARQDDRRSKRPAHQRGRARRSVVARMTMTPGCPRSSPSRPEAEERLLALVVAAAQAPPRCATRVDSSMNRARRASSLPARTFAHARQTQHTKSRRSRTRNRAGRQLGLAGVALATEFAVREAPSGATRDRPPRFWNLDGRARNSNSGDFLLASFTAGTAAESHRIVDSSRCAPCSCRTKTRRRALPLHLAHKKTHTPSTGASGTRK